MSDLLKLPCGGGLFDSESFSIEKKNGKEYIKAKNKGGISSWNDIPDRPFYDESHILYEGYPEYEWGYARLPFVIRDGVEYAVSVVNDSGSLRSSFCTAVKNGNSIDAEYTDSANEDSFRLFYAIGDSFTAFYPDGSNFRDGWPDESPDGSYAYTSKVKIQIAFAHDSDIGVVPINAKYLPKATAIADLTEAPTAEDFNALLISLREAGYLAQ